MMESSFTDRVTSEEILRTVKEGRNILHTTKRRKATWIGYIWRRNCLLSHVTEGKIEGKEYEEENVSSYWINFRKQEDNGYRERKQQIALPEKLVLEEVMNLP
jgi:hypothetical protein